MFEAQWISLSPRFGNALETSDGLTWAPATSAAELERWELAWTKGDATQEEPRIFLPRLLSVPGVVFLLGFRGDRPLCGGILNRGAEVVGLSNVFSSEVGSEIVWRGLISQAAAIFPDLPLVGYERQAELTAALRAGFEPIGPLRIWIRQ
ncbi:hypothetical protein [Methylocapsa sp. S129]|uniref:hypothetical protein n=1 Tax=Methylocapsa sp. S129 TaxID=1641869 RepID=UPI00131DB515|nr:hypothetical protein [Methylocapsa sp. S129]